MIFDKQPTVYLSLSLSLMYIYIYIHTRTHTYIYIVVGIPYTVKSAPHIINYVYVVYAISWEFLQVDQLEVDITELGDSVNSLTKDAARNTLEYRNAACIF